MSTTPSRISTPSDARRRPALVEAGLRILLLLALWWVISEGARGALLVGVPVAAATAVASLWLAPAPLRAPGLVPVLRFLPFFLKQSVLGGVDVLRRAFDPALPLAPAIRTYGVERMGDGERIAFAIVVSLLPGTLSARLDGDVLRLHVLDERMAIDEMLCELEANLAPLFGRRIGGESGP